MGKMLCAEICSIYPIRDVKQAVNAENLKSFTQNSCVNRLASILFFISEGTVTKEEIKHGFLDFFNDRVLVMRSG